MAILGIDEVGRGPLAGPLVMGAVILPESAYGPQRPKWVMQLRDSKKLSAKNRIELARHIRKKSAYGLGWVWPNEIDELGMPEALKRATRLAVKEVQSKHVPFSEIVIDGDTNFLEGTALEPYTTTVVKGDDKVKAVSAASIVAKVARDNYMIEKSREYPNYKWEKNVGYGTPEHRNAIDRYGLTPEHRLSFEPCRSIAGFKPTWREKQKKNTTGIGRKAEKAVAEYLKAHGHMIVGQNVKNKFSEIDIVSVDIETMKIFFTEVKYRKNGERGGGLAAVDAEKLVKMRLGAESFLRSNKKFADYDPLLTVAVVSGEDFRVDDWFAI